MNGYLLDTNAALIALTDPGRLPQAMQTAMLAGPNVISVVSYWEVLLKSMKGTLDVGDPRRWWHDTIDQLAATVLSLKPDHVGMVQELLPLHKDPFDRVLIAQAVVEGLEMVTLDSDIRRYASPVFRVIS